MMSKSGKQKPAAVGLMSLFAVLITLCLVIFAILARLTAHNELALAQRAADTVSTRYENEFRYVVYGELPEVPEPPATEPPVGLQPFDPN